MMIKEFLIKMTVFNNIKAQNLNHSLRFYRFIPLQRYQKFGFIITSFKTLVPGSYLVKYIRSQLKA